MQRDRIEREIKFMRLTSTMHGRRRQQEIGGRSGGALLILGRRTYGARVGDEVARRSATRNLLAVVGASPPGSTNHRSPRGPFSPFHASAIPPFLYVHEMQRKVFGCHLDSFYLLLARLSRIYRRCDSLLRKTTESRANLFLFVQPSLAQLTFYPICPFFLCYAICIQYETGDLIKRSKRRGKLEIERNAARTD